MQDKERIIAAMQASIKEYDEIAAEASAQQAVEAGLDLLEAVEEGFAIPIRELGEAFDRMDIFLPELMLAADAMARGMEVLDTAIKTAGGVVQKKGVVVLGTVAGDIHDIGKTVVGAMLQANGYEVHDLGVEVPDTQFIEAARSHNADIIAMSALLSTTMLHQNNVIELLSNKGERDNYFIIVGGAPVTQAWSDEIGADGFARDAFGAVKLLDSHKEAWTR